MADTLSIIGAVSGVIGTVTGVTGAILGYVGYRRSVNVRKLDQRLNLRTAVNELRSTAVALPPLLQSAHQSHANELSAHGLGSSGNMQVWRENWERDGSRVKELIAQVPTPNADFAGLSESELETMIVAFHALALECNGLRDKYSSTLAADDRMREQLRAERAQLEIKDWRSPGG